jgi:dTDP-4-amino-4,6-dideoxygalactose transaminase
MTVPFLSFQSMHAAIRNEMGETFSRVYDSNWFVNGENLVVFEKKYAAINQTKYAIGVSNGLDALILSLKVLGVGPGDEVLVPSNTYIATALAVSHVGATPVFVEPNFQTYNIDPQNLELSITRKTKAIMPVHLYGQACEMDKIIEFAVGQNLFVVEDNAQAHLAAFKGKLTGSWGHINGTSFYPGKNLGALGDAGAITSDNERYAKQVEILRNYGSRVKYVNDEVGYNMRLDELQAGFLSVKLKYLQDWTNQRQIIAQNYKELLSRCSDIILPQVHVDATHSYHLYVIRTNRRDELQRHLESKGIGTMIHYPIPPHLQRAYESLGYKIGDFPIAEELARTSLSLPIWPGLSADQVLYISSIINEFFNA